MSLAPFLRENEVSEDRISSSITVGCPGSQLPSPHSQTQMQADQAAVLWKRWRLLEDRELYDLASDPLQKKNVIGKHPEVVAKCASASIRGGTRSSTRTRSNGLPSSERSMRTRPNRHRGLDVFVDRGANPSGRIEERLLVDRRCESREYEIELGRWPKEADGTISGTLPDGSGTAFAYKSSYALYERTQPLEDFEKKSYQFED